MRKRPGIRSFPFSINMSLVGLPSGLAAILAKAPEFAGWFQGRGHWSGLEDWECEQAWLPERRHPSKHSRCPEFQAEKAHPMPKSISESTPFPEVIISLICQYDVRCPCCLRRQENQRATQKYLSSQLQRAQMWAAKQRKGNTKYSLRCNQWGDVEWFGPGGERHPPRWPKLGPPSASA